MYSNAISIQLLLMALQFELLVCMKMYLSDVWLILHLKYFFLPVIRLNFAGNFGGIFVITLEERLQETKVVFRII